MMLPIQVKAHSLGHMFSTFSCPKKIMIQSTLIDSFIKKKTSMYGVGELIVDVSIYFFSFAS